jgi:hypothetical protein
MSPTWVIDLRRSMRIYSLIYRYRYIYIYIHLNTYAYLGRVCLQYNKGEEEEEEEEEAHISCRERRHLLRASPATTRGPMMRKRLSAGRVQELPPPPLSSSQSQ